MMLWHNTALEQSNEDSNMSTRKSLERMHREDSRVERVQALISYNSGQSLRILMDVVKPWKLCSEGHMFFSMTVHRLIRVI